jgi:iron complex transport system permease protein
MKIVLDVDQLLKEGRITSEERDRLSALAVRETASLAFNILIGFGVIATAGGALALLPSVTTAIVLGLLLSASGACLSATSVKEWGLLGSILLLVGAITAASGILCVAEGSIVGFLIVTLLLLIGSVLAKSGLLAALAVISLSSTVGAMTSYQHAVYTLTMHQPTVTVVLFSLLALASYHSSKVVSLSYQRLVVIAARTSLFVVNLGFWIGSLWGDLLGAERDVWGGSSNAVIPDWVFIIGWAVALVATGVWAAGANKRWVVNLVAVFGAIHFYTQLFGRLRYAPGVILFAGVVALVIAFAIVRYNKGAVAAAAEHIKPPS